MKKDYCRILNELNAILDEMMIMVTDDKYGMNEKNMDIMDENLAMIGNVINNIRKDMIKIKEGEETEN